MIGSRPVPLTPLGTARERFLRTNPNARDHALGPPSHFPRDLFDSIQGEDGPELLFTAWEILRGADALDPGTERTLLLLTVASLVASRYGSTRIPLSGPESEASVARGLTELGLSPPDPADVRRLVDEALENPGGPVRRILGTPDEFTPLVTNGAWLAQKRLLHYESRLVEALRARLQAPPREIRHSDAVLALLRDKRPVVRGREITLSLEQERAVLTALKSSLTIITGGPGTGKTSIVVSIVRALVREGVAPADIALAAPTGKAANRMQEAVSRYLETIHDLADRALLKSAPPGRTLHRLLGYSPETDRFHHHENNRLAEAVVIVDESSMIDLFLMDRLVRAVRPDARLVLLGDSDQLPSVEAGAVFRDVAKAAGACVLRNSYRMDPQNPAGRNILAVARTVNSGDVARLFEAELADEVVTVRPTPAEVKFEKVELLESATPTLDALLDRWWSERVHAFADLNRLADRRYRYAKGIFDASDTADLSRLSAHFESFRILCLTRGEWPSTGAEAVNKALHQRALESWRAGGNTRTSPEMLPGEPVLVQKNDYQRSVFNGDQGLVLRVQFEGSEAAHFAAVFPQASSFVAFPLDGLRPILSLAYATTVHKAQGSEFDSVALVLPAEDSPLLTREILYTAVSRSRRSVVIVGSRKLIELGAGRRIERFSGIAEALAAGGPVRTS